MKNLSKFISNTGYKKDSPDKNRSMNIIPSSHITMENVMFPILGVDNLGNKKIMQPGQDYHFPGDWVVETPIMQNGGVPEYRTSNYNDYVNRKQAYNDSLNVHDIAKQETDFFKILGYKGTSGNLTLPEGVVLNVRDNMERAGDFNTFFNSRKNLKNLNGISPQGISSFPLDVTDNDDGNKVIRTDTMLNFKKPTQPVTFVPDPKVVEKQKLLKDAGLYNGKLDGIWGPKSEEAWKKYNEGEKLYNEYHAQFNKYSGNNDTEASKYANLLMNLEGTSNVIILRGFDKDGHPYSYSLPQSYKKPIKNTPQTATPKEVVPTIVQTNNIPQTPSPQPKTAPIGTLKIAGREIPYYSEEELKKLQDSLSAYGILQNQGDYSKTKTKFFKGQDFKGWDANGHLVDKTGKIIFKEGGSVTDWEVVNDTEILQSGGEPSLLQQKQLRSDLEKFLAESQKKRDEKNAQIEAEKQARLKHIIEVANASATTNKITTLPNGPAPSEIKTAPERQSYAGKALNVFANPVTALGYIARNQEIPDNMPRTNPFDYAADAGKLALGLGAFNSAPVVQALGTNIGGVAGLTGNNLINGYFAYEGLHNAPNVVNQWKNVNNVNDAAGALINTGLTGLSILPMGIEVAPGIRSAVNASRESGVLSPRYYNTAINDLKEIKDISKSLLNKPELINNTEKKILDAVRRTGSLINKGAYNDEKLLQKVLENANQLSDSHFESITGFSKSDIKQRIEELKNITSKKQISDTIHEGTIDLRRNIDPLTNSNELAPPPSEIILDHAFDGFQRIPPVPPLSLSSELNNLTPGGIWGTNNSDIDNFYRSIIQYRNRNGLYESYDMQNIFNYNNTLSKFTGSIKNQLIKKSGFQTQQPMMDINGNTPSSLIGSLVTSSNNNPGAEMLSAAKRVLNATSGEKFKPSGSLSTDSYPMSLDLIKKFALDNKVEPIFHGMNPLNSLGFPTVAGIDPKISIKEINTILKQLNEGLAKGKKIPYATIKNKKVYAPSVSIIRKQKGGSINEWEIM